MQQKLKQNSCCSPLLSELCPNLANSMKTMNSRCKSYPDCSKCHRVSAKLKHDRNSVLQGKKEKKKRRNNSQFQQTKWDSTSTGAEGAPIATIWMAQGSTQLKHDQGSSQWSVCAPRREHEEAPKQSTISVSKLHSRCQRCPNCRKTSYRKNLLTALTPNCGGVGQPGSNVSTRPTPS